MNIIQRPLAALLLSITLAFALVTAVACGANDADAPGADTPQATATAAPGAGAPAATTLDLATQPGPYAVGVMTIELVDTSRPTAKNGDFAGSPERRMKTEIWYPAGAPASSSAPETRDAPLDDEGGPYPLIVFAHGYTGTRVQSHTYTQHLASHGYVVAAPDFPLSNADAPGGPTVSDLGNQPVDVSFVIDRMIAFSGDQGHALYGAVDGERIGMTGHSLGAFTTLFTVYGGNRDERIDAALPLSGSGCFLSQQTIGDTAVPIMMMTGSDDLIVAPGGNRQAYDLANAPRYWVELIGGGHIRFADADVDDAPFVAALNRRLGREASARPAVSCGPETALSGAPIKLARQQELLRAFATPFFDAYLRGSEDAKRFLEQELPSLLTDAAHFEFEAR